ncbi:hypothetical protein CPter91_4421 [Collimonas pratensis]|uniref:Uncharacterized protein n=1 Tax=Collimonas pratensis TaxID=279113 RepID=A0A127Q9I2_9BURK|nr:hypothetical protein CPter91_4421 [Collimonas pratensis]
MQVLNVALIASICDIFMLLREYEGLFGAGNEKRRISGVS